MSFPQVFLCDLVPHCEEDALIVILNCFFDGGNKSDSGEYDYVTLSLVAATFKHWKPFEKAWIRNLHKHGADYLHTTDAVVGNTLTREMKDGIEIALMPSCLTASR